uniref:Uncharacterized protein n=1 Tax=Romanomermis culicivorax TaxID=13658 RepID=A0A915JHH6_ROMCU
MCTAISYFSAPMANKFCLNLEVIPQEDFGKTGVRFQPAIDSRSNLARDSSAPNPPESKNLGELADFNVSFLICATYAFRYQTHSASKYEQVRIFSNGAVESAIKSLVSGHLPRRTAPAPPNGQTRRLGVVANNGQQEPTSEPVGVLVYGSRKQYSPAEQLSLSPKSEFFTTHILLE